MHIEWAINPTNIIAFVTLLVTFIKMHTSNVERMTRFETKIDLMWKTWMKNSGLNHDS